MRTLSAIVIGFLLAAGVAGARSNPTLPLPDTRGIWSRPPGVVTYGYVSADGRYLAYGDLVDLEVHVRDLETGTSRRLTNRETMRNGPNEDPGNFSDDRWAFSPDNRQLAYSWRAPGHGQLHVMDLQGAGINRPRILVDGHDVEWFSVLGWSPDSQWIAAAFRRLGRQETELARVSMADGAVTLLVTVSGNADGRLSPDGKFIAYAAPRSTGGPRDVVAIPTGGGTPVPVVTALPAEPMLRVAGWSPDGSNVVFLRDDGLAATLWTTPFPGNGTDRRRLADLGRVEADLGVTPSGAFYYIAAPGTEWRTKVFSMDFERGRLLGPPADITPNMRGLTFLPDAFSPDGRLLASVSEAETPNDHLVYIQDLERNEGRELRVKLSGYGKLIWLPDSRAFAVMGFETPSKSLAEFVRNRSIFRVDTATGDVVQVAKGTGELRAWSSAGKAYYEVLDENGRGDMTLVERDAASGAQRVVHRWPRGETGRSSVALALDARTLYFRDPPLPEAPSHRIVARDLTTDRQQTLVEGGPFGALAIVANGAFLMTTSSGEPVLVPTNGGAVRALPGVGGRTAAPVAWAADGRSFLGRATVADNPAGGTKEGVGQFWWIPLDVRPARAIDLGIEGQAGGFLVSGSRVVFAERLGPANPRPEVRVVEGLFAPAGVRP